MVVDSFPCWDVQTLINGSSKQKYGTSNALTMHVGEYSFAHFLFRYEPNINKWKKKAERNIAQPMGWMNIMNSKIYKLYKQTNEW